MRTTTSLLAVAIVVILAGCGEGSSGGSGVGASSLTIASSTPANRATNASLTEPILITVKEALDSATVNTDTIQLIPDAGDVGHGGMSMGGTASMPGMAINLGRLAGIDVSSDEYLTPAGTVKGTVSLDAKTGTIISFVPKTQLAPGTSYSIMVHGLKTKAGKNFGDSAHAIPLALTTAASQPVRMTDLSRSGTTRTSFLGIENNVHVVKRYTGEFQTLADATADSTKLNRITKHDINLPDASASFIGTARSVTFDVTATNPTGDIVRYDADIKKTGTSQPAADATFIGKGSDGLWGTHDDLIRDFTQDITLTLQQSWRAINATPNTADVGFPYNLRLDTTKFEVDEINVMIFDAINQRSVQKHVRFKNPIAAAAPDAGKVATQAGDVRYYHDYRYNADSRLTMRIRMEPQTGAGATFGAGDVIKQCRQYEYSQSTRQLIRVLEYKYATSPSAVSGDTCPIDGTRTLSSYTIKNYNADGTSERQISKKAAASATAPADTDVTTSTIFFGPNLPNF